MKESKPIATDMEMALHWVKHIKKPCEDLSGNNARNIYLEEAERMLSTIKDPVAKEILVEVIMKYQLI